MVLVRLTRSLVLAATLCIPPLAHALDPSLVDLFQRYDDGVNFHLQAANVVNGSVQMIGNWDNINSPSVDWTNINRVLDFERYVRQQNPSSVIVIDVPSTTVRLTTTIGLNEQDSGASGGQGPLFIRGDASGRSVLSGAQAYALSGIPPSDRGNLAQLGARQLDLSGLPWSPILTTRYWGGHTDSTFDMYQGDVRFTPSQYPGRDISSWLQNSNVSFDAPTGGATLHFPLDHDSWRAVEPEIWIGGYWDASGGWAYETTPIYGTAAGATLYTRPLVGQALYGTSVSPRFYMFNLYSAMANAGDMMLDSVGKKVTFLPISQTADVEVPMLGTLLAANNVHDVVIQNVAFEKALGTAVTFSNSSWNLITKSYIGHTGKGGIMVDYGSTGIGVTFCVLDDFDDWGVWLRGGDKATLVSSSHYLTGQCRVLLRGQGVDLG